MMKGQVFWRIPLRCCLGPILQKSGHSANTSRKRWNILISPNPSSMVGLNWQWIQQCTHWLKPTSLYSLLSLGIPPDTHNLWLPKYSRLASIYGRMHGITTSLTSTSAVHASGCWTSWFQTSTKCPTIPIFSGGIRQWVFSSFLRNWKHRMVSQRQILFGIVTPCSLPISIQ